MSADPAAWDFTGAMATTEVWSMRERGWKQDDVNGVGCLAAAIATLMGWQGQFAAAAMGASPSVDAGRRLIEAWDPDLTLASFTPDDPWPETAKVIALYRAGRPGRGEKGRFAPAPVHAVVLHGDDGSLYHDPHPEPLMPAEEIPWLGVLAVVRHENAPAPTSLEA